ncbi:MAG: hypothetical protein PUG74_00155, partial [Prevotellaceae bacterium]|nr:hypothetical protein [Prevotellaceae bacterium]
MMSPISTKNDPSSREKKARISFHRISPLIRVFFKQGNPYANLMASTSRKKKNQTLAQRKRSLMGQRLLTVFMGAYLVFMTVLFSKNLALAYITLGEDRAFFDLLLSFFALTTVFFGFFQTFSYLVFGE